MLVPWRFLQAENVCAESICLGKAAGERIGPSWQCGAPWPNHTSLCFSDRCQMRLCCFPRQSGFTLGTPPEGAVRSRPQLRGRLCMHPALVSSRALLRSPTLNAASPALVHGSRAEKGGSSPPGQLGGLRISRREVFVSRCPQAPRPLGDSSGPRMGLCSVQPGCWGQWDAL